MANLKADSPLCRRIITSFLDFLNSEAKTLKRIKSSSFRSSPLLPCIPHTPITATRLHFLRFGNPRTLGELGRAQSLLPLAGARMTPHLAVYVRSFCELPHGSDNGIKSDQVREKFQDDTFHVSSALKDLDSMSPETIQFLFEYEDPRNPVTASEIEFLYQFRDALEKARFFGNTPNGFEVLLQTIWMFEGALKELKNSGVTEFDLQKMADTFNLKGNRSMEKKLYTDAIGHYSAAIALFDDNAVYYCNRAAAYTWAKQYTEAISDCHKAVVIDPSYSKAYSRLGFAYHAQGNYMDAIEKGYKKALQLDPDNETIKGNIQAAKLMEKLGSAFADGTQDHPRGN
ncbi:uncharacterized protein [Rutidosis leptorrhynchoides]|uniref:uncharacterized protein n=1 Tax=Rutidosis leptorrhynchoides TaxID=125765 RepID=UPI003A99C996